MCNLFESQFIRHLRFPFFFFFFFFFCLSISLFCRIGCIRVFVPFCSFLYTFSLLIPESFFFFCLVLFFFFCSSFVCSHTRHGYTVNREETFSCCIKQNQKKKRKKYIYKYIVEETWSHVRLILMTSFLDFFFSLYPKALIVLYSDMMD